MNRPIRRLTLSRLLSLTLLPATLLVWRPAAAAAQGDAASRILGAVRAGELAQVHTLLEASPELVNVRDGEGMTPLHHAVLGGHAELAELLL
ncbi:MAG: ankyrin repeat domain-containing protein, partial [Gemmatimonadota bacterium]